MNHHNVLCLIVKVTERTVFPAEQNRTHQTEDYSTCLVKRLFQMAATQFSLNSKKDCFNKGIFVKLVISRSVVNHINHYNLLEVLEIGCCYYTEA